jgi:hypothetical protein
VLVHEDTSDFYIAVKGLLGVEVRQTADNFLKDPANLFLG